MSGERSTESKSEDDGVGNHSVVLGCESSVDDEGRGLVRK